MEKKQLYAIAIVAILVVAAVGVYVLVADGGKNPEAFTDAAGNEITIPDNVETITAASPAVADIICYMGYADKIVAVSKYCTHPDIPAAALANLTGSYTAPETDKISSMNADVTFIDGSNSNAVNSYNTLRSAGMFVVLLYGSQDPVDGIYKNVEIVGKIMKNDKYADEVDDLKNEVSSLKTATASASQVNIIISTSIATLATDNDGNFTNLDSFNGSSVSCAGNGSAQFGMASAVGNVATPIVGSGWAYADTDFISTSTADVDVWIILWTNKNSMPNEAAIDLLLTKLRDPASPWSNCGAVQSGNLIFIGGDSGADLSRSTPYTVYRGLPILSLYVNPECYSKTAGGSALSLSDLPYWIDNTNRAQLIGYTENVPA